MERRTFKKRRNGTIPAENSHGEMIVYQSADGQTHIDVRFENETVWLSIDRMAELFDRDKSTISRHIKNVFSEGELVQDATVAKFATVQTEGSRKVERLIKYYNLDVIISVGYRIKSLRGTRHGGIGKAKGTALKSSRFRRCAFFLL